MWKHRGQQRPDFALPTTDQQESIWDYPRPPAIVEDRRHIQVLLDYMPIAESFSTLRVLETASAPTFYIPAKDVNQSLLLPTRHSSHCEWKGTASYWGVAAAGNPGAPQDNVAWSYTDPSEEFAAIAGWFAFYPDKLTCLVDGEPVKAQEGGFYGGWITSEVVGPFKGKAGTGHW